MSSRDIVAAATLTGLETCKSDVVDFLNRHDWKISRPTKAGQWPGTECERTLKLPRRPYSECPLIPARTMYRAAAVRPAVGDGYFHWGSHILGGQ